MLWEMDVWDVLGLCHPGDAAHQHLVTAAKESVLRRIAFNPAAWPKSVLTMLQVGGLLCGCCKLCCLHKQLLSARMQIPVHADLLRV